jgi:hypothetical protein
MGSSSEYLPESSEHFGAAENVPSPIWAASGCPIAAVLLMNIFRTNLYISIEMCIKNAIFYTRWARLSCKEMGLLLYMSRRS